MMAQKEGKKQKSLIICLTFSLAMLTWWAASNIAMLSAIILPTHHIVNNAESGKNKLSIPVATYRPVHYLSFNGKNGYGLIPGNQNLNVRQFSISFWIKNEGSSHDFDRPIEMLQWVKSTNGPSIPYGWDFDVGNQSQVGHDRIYFRVGNMYGNLFGTNPATVSSDGWTNIVGTYDGKSLKLFQNAVLAGEFPFKGAYAYPIPPLPIQIANGWLPHQYWSGDLSDIRIYGRPLSQMEITSIFNGRESQGLIGHWQLYEGSGNLIHDSSGNNNNGRINNGLWR